jgi:hypothetical protein
MSEYRKVIAVINFGIIPPENGCTYNNILILIVTSIPPLNCVILEKKTSKDKNKQPRNIKSERFCSTFQKLLIAE